MTFARHARNLFLPVLALLAFSSQASAQDFTYRGFAEVRSSLYPQSTPQDSDRIAVEGRFRVEAAYRPIDWLTTAGSLDIRLDNLEQVERQWRLDFRERAARRSVTAVRHATATVRRGTLVIDAGKQFVRWGKADILNPTDRFAPKDFLEVTNDEFLAVIGVRAQYERAGHTLDGVWVPIFTPSRIPLIGRRWVPLPVETFGGLGFVDLPPEFPDRSQYGLRWNVVGSGFEASASYFDGFNHLPLFDAAVLSGRPLIALERTYAPLRMAGGDAAVPLPWFTIKGEAAALFTTSERADDVVLYVVQLERQTGELSLVGGYAGEVVLAQRSTFDFAPDRGLTRALLGRASYTISATRDFAVETAVRQDLNGVWVKAQYSQAVGAHWRATVAAAVIGGDEQDFIGQYQRNSHLLLSLRYSF